MQGWAQMQLEEEQWYCETDFTVNGKHYFSGRRNEFNSVQPVFNTGE